MTELKSIVMTDEQGMEWKSAPLKWDSYGDIKDEDFEYVSSTFMGDFIIRRDDNDIENIILLFSVYGDKNDDDVELPFLGEYETWDEAKVAAQTLLDKTVGRWANQND